MNRYVSFTGGKPDFNIDDILWNDEATRLALQETLRAYGDNFIVQGCKLSGAAVSAGYIMLDSELIRVESHTKTSTHFVKVTTYDTGGDVTFNDGSARQTWQKNRATVTAGSGNLEFLDINRLRRQITLEIGDWDMDATQTNNVAHGLSATEWKTLSVDSIVIRNDADDNYTFLDSVDNATTPFSQGGVIGWGSVNIQLTRTSTGKFNAVAYDSTSYNRGWIYGSYIPD